MKSITRLAAVLALITMAFSVPPAAALAQAPPRLSNLTIRLWPEFDRPEVLVFMIGQTAPGTLLPATLTFRLPPGATVNAVAYVNDQNVLTDHVEHTVDDQTVSITTPTGSFHIEFYDPGLALQSGGRRYTFTWLQDIPVKSLTWQVEQPAGASGLTLIPVGVATGTDENKLPLWQAPGGAVASREAAELSLSYYKPNDSLTIDALAAAQQVPPTLAEPANNTTSIIIAAVILVLALSVFALVVQRRAGAGGAAQPETSPAQRGKKGRDRFCPQCGKPARARDTFCRKCGTKLRA